MTTEINLQGRLRNLETAVFGGANVAPEPLPDSTLPLIESMIQLKTLTLTNAQIKALPTTPIEAIPAPGPGKQVVPWLAFCRLDSGGAYTNFDMSTLLALAYEESSNSILATSAPDLLLGSSVDYNLQLAPASGTGDVDAVVVDAPVMLKFANGSSGNLTGGNAANALTIQIYYGTIDVG